MQLESPLESVMAAAKSPIKIRLSLRLTRLRLANFLRTAGAGGHYYAKRNGSRKAPGIRVENDEDAAKAAQVLHEKVSVLY